MHSIYYLQREMQNIFLIDQQTLTTITEIIDLEQDNS